MRTCMQECVMNVSMCVRLRQRHEEHESGAVSRSAHPCPRAPRAKPRRSRRRRQGRRRRGGACTGRHAAAARAISFTRSTHLRHELSQGCHPNVQIARLWHSDLTSVLTRREPARENDPSHRTQNRTHEKICQLHRCININGLAHSK